MLQIFFVFTWFLWTAPAFLRTKPSFPPASSWPSSLTWRTRQRTSWRRPRQRPRTSCACSRTGGRGQSGTSYSCVSFRTAKTVNLCLGNPTYRNRGRLHKYCTWKLLVCKGELQQTKLHTWVPWVGLFPNGAPPTCQKSRFCLKRCRTSFFH